MFKNGEPIFDQEKIQQEFLSYFQILSGTTDPKLCYPAWEQLYPDILPDLHQLDSPFLENKIHDALFSLPKDKAPGPNGFPISFYQRFWETFKADITNLFKELSNGKSDISRLKYSYTVLIPKKSDKPTVRGFRPISLEHGLIKIISKALLIRLSKVMDLLISESQTAFIKGHSIFESFATVSEITNVFIKLNTPEIL